MISKIFPYLTKFAWFRRFIWKRIYNKLARNFPTDEWTFMNYGYAYHDKNDSVQLHDNQEINRYSIQLYHSTIHQVDHNNKDVLEVGSGRGGGANYLASGLYTSSVTGMDLAKEAVQLCNENFNHQNLKYVEGNSENMPFDKESFDIVVNVESSHAYGSVEKFFSEVKRVLKETGYFLLTDFRDQAGLVALRAQLENCGLKLISETEITQNVIRAIEEEDKLKKERIRKHIPDRIHGMFEQFAGVIGSKVHQGLVNKDMVYYQFVLQKV